MGSGWIVMVTISWLTSLALGKATCREIQMHRDCDAVCSSNREGAVSCELRVAVILPADPSFDISLPKVLPVLDLAVYEARSRGLLPYWLKLKFLPQDDHCDAMYAQIGAIDSYSNCVHLFLGPACDYCVAVVGRVVKFFGAPLITTGGFTFDFTEKKTECKDEYFMTTRIGSMAFRDLANFFVALMDRYEWRKVHLVYATNGQSQVAGRHTCQLMMKSMVEFIKKQQNFTFGTFDVEATTPRDYPEAMRDHVGNWYSGIDGDFTYRRIAHFGRSTEPLEKDYSFYVPDKSYRSRTITLQDFSRNSPRSPGEQPKVCCFSNFLSCLRGEQRVGCLREKLFRSHANS